jgi:hypothetical protein
MKSQPLNRTRSSWFFHGRIACTFLALVLGIASVSAQKAVHASDVKPMDESQLRREVELAQNILATLIKQQFDERTYVPLELSVSYQSGYGLTFSMPSSYVLPIVLMSGGASGIYSEPAMTVRSRNYTTPSVPALTETTRDPREVMKLEDAKTKHRRSELDSAREAYTQRIIDAAKIFMADFGDMLTQLPSSEKIIVTNQGNQPRTLAGQYFGAQPVAYVSVEATKSDMVAHKQGKGTRQQALDKIKVINAEVVRTVEPDLELLSSIFTRLYRVDLAKTYFVEQQVYFDRLRDFGAVYYMQVLSTTQTSYTSFDLPTLGLENVDLATRNIKVTELYPRFEQELKENILEYGRTVKALGNDESLIFKVSITPCPNCGIPASLEVSIKGSVLKEYQGGKITKDVALGKFILKKGSVQ